MTGSPGERWKVFADGDDIDDVPLWKVLAKIRADDQDEGLSLNAAFLKGIKPRFSRSYNLAIGISGIFGFLALFSLIGLAAATRSESSDFFYYCTLLMLAGTIAPYLWRRAYQYGLAVPDAPLGLPHPSDPLFEEVLGHLQKVDGPRAYYISRFGKKRIALNRRQFFGRLRYFLLSEQGDDRAIVMRFPTAMSLPADLYLHREDMERMLAMSAPKRSGGPGRNVKYAYVEAAFDLRADPRLATLDLNDEAAAVRSLTDWFDEWFDSAANVSGDIPKRDRLTPYARKIYAHLKKSTSSDDR
ncbi:hypothetical protein NS277_11415 [Novosphingobium barchaimii]|nr:hypothetical protein NS277_11415 [Novosphingobium barchaimii]